MDVYTQILTLDREIHALRVAANNAIAMWSFDRAAKIKDKIARIERRKDKLRRKNDN